jgi:predicted Zn-dependent protease
MASNQMSNCFMKDWLKNQYIELGHAFGLAHCSSTRCVMHFSNSLHDTDFKKRDFCDSCSCKWN